jgi:hypothetical protein
MLMSMTSLVAWLAVYPRVPLLVFDLGAGQPQ